MNKFLKVLVFAKLQIKVWWRHTTCENLSTLTSQKTYTTDKKILCTKILHFTKFTAASYNAKELTTQKLTKNWALTCSIAMFFELALIDDRYKQIDATHY